jgi:Domain of unknown function (DUF4345)
MYALTILVRILCFIPFATGALDLVLGAKAFSPLGTQISTEALADPSLNSQIRFFGAIWLGFGCLLWHSSSDLKTHATWFRLMGFTLVLSGVGRLISWIQFGVPVTPFIGATLVELLLIPCLLLWHWHLLRKG